jgi:hypothetical protein
MKCDKILVFFIYSDNYRKTSFLIFLHILFCKKCRKIIEKTKSEMLKLQTEAPFVTKDMMPTIMKKITKEQSLTEPYKSFWPWVFAGVLIVIGNMMFSYSSTFTLLKNYFGSNLEIPITICFGLTTIIYFIVFIGTRIDRLKRVFHL